MEKESKNSLDWKEIGRRFKELRLNKGFGQAELVEKAKSFNGSISMFERGATPASTNYALFLRNEFGASFDWLYCGDVIDRNYEDVQKKRVFDPHAIGARLKAIRVSEGLNKEEFGKVIGVTGKAVAQYETGARTPEIKTALKIKRALNKPLDWIYFGDKCILTKGGITQPIATKPCIPLKQFKKELKEEAISYIKNMNESELAMLTTRLRMEQRNNATPTNTTQDSQHNTTQHNTFSPESENKSSE